jgi:hypothetical protein
MIHHGGPKEILVITTQINSTVTQDVVSAGLPILESVVNEVYYNTIKC